MKEKAEKMRKEGIKVVPLVLEAFGFLRAATNPKDNIKDFCPDESAGRRGETEELIRPTEK